MSDNHNVDVNEAVTRYTLLCYKANAVDTCRGCVMDRFDSDFQFFIETDIESIAQAWAKVLLNHELVQRDTSYEFTLLVNGEDNGTWSDEYEACWKRVTELVDKAHQEREEKKKEKERLAELARIAEKAKSRKRQREADLAELARLKKEYE